MVEEQSIEFAGKCIIVVEDDYLLATEICSEFQQAGATVLGPAPTPFYAKQLVSRRRIDAAVLDIGLHGTNVYEFADHLRSQGVPLLFATASERMALPARFSEVPVLTKPYDHKTLLRDVYQLMRAPVVRSLPVAKLAAPILKEAPAQLFARALGSRFRGAN